MLLTLLHCTVSIGESTAEKLNKLNLIVEGTLGQFVRPEGNEIFSLESSEVQILSTAK